MTSKDSKDKALAEARQRKIDRMKRNAIIGGYVEFTSIDGVLDLISVRGRPHFSIREHNTNHHIRCVFSDELFEVVKDLLRKRVVVEGLTRFNRDGTPTHISDIKTLWSRPDPKMAFGDLVGSRPDFTGGIPAGEYVRRMRTNDDAL